MQRVKKILPTEMWFSLILTFVCGVIIYYGARFLTADRYHYNLSVRLDDQIPFIPWTLVIYLGSYIFWIVNYVIGCRQDEENAYRFISADLLAKIVCLFCFLLFPTTNIRPYVAGDSIWDEGIQMLYQLDIADNLFPSVHCMTSQFCLIAVRESDKIPCWYCISSMLIVVGICISTLTVKQHVLIDMAAGIVLAEGSYLFVEKSGFTKRYAVFVKRCTAKLKKK